MSFTSEIGSMLVIDNDNYKDHIETKIDGVLFGRGYMPRDYSKVARGALPFSARHSLPNWSRQEIKERIEGAEKTKSRLTDKCDFYGLGVKNQSSLNYCWVYAVTHCVEIVRLIQGCYGNRYVELAPESVGGPITGYRNVGGWANTAIDYFGKNGAVPRSMWPAWSLNSRLMTEQAKQEREKYKLTEVWELEEGNFEQLCICLLLNNPVALGLSWWSHEITAMAPVILKNGGLGVTIDNSWGKNWGDNGRGVLTEDKARGDMYAPRVAIL